MIIPSGKDFSPAQHSAIHAPTDVAQLLVLAGPGSGKTAVIIERIHHLIVLCGVEPKDIFVVTFTNKAARELTERLRLRLGSLWGVGAIPLGYCGTIHGLCLRMLEGWGGWKPGLLVLDEAQSDAMLLQVAALIGYGKLPLAKIKAVRDKVSTNAGACTPLLPETLVVATYYKRLKKQNAIDFQGLLFEARRMLSEVPVRAPFLFVDEYQDICAIDAEIFDKLLTAQRFYVGDPDQAIYSFRGGDIHQILLEASEASTMQIALEDNFRSTEVICTAAQKLIENNTARVQKVTKATFKGGDPVTFMASVNDIGEAVEVGDQIEKFLDAGLLPYDIAVLARTNAIANEFRAYARASYVWPLEDDREDMAPDTPFAAAVMGFLAAPSNELAAELFIGAKDGPEKVNMLKRQAAMECRALADIYFGGHPPICHLASLVPHRMRQFGCTESSVERVVDIVHTLPPLSTPADLLLALRSHERARSRKRGVAITTMHAAKGREWPVVFLIGMEQEIVPGKNDIEEERRLIFVAATRAKDRLIVSHACSRRQPFGKHEARLMAPSQFIGELLCNT